MIADRPERSLVNKLFAAIDARSTDEFLACLAPDASFRFGSAPEVDGHDAIRTAVEQFFASIGGLSHRVDRAISDNGALVCEGEVTYTRHDDSELTLPFVTVFDLAGGLIGRYRIYIDIAPLYGST